MAWAVLVSCEVDAGNLHDATPLMLAAEGGFQVLPFWVDPRRNQPLQWDEVRFGVLCNRCRDEGLRWIQTLH